MGILSLIKPLKNYEDYFYKAYTYENLFFRQRAIQTMKIAIEQPFSKREKSSGLIYLAFLYTKSKEYKKAADCYHNGFEIMKDEEFQYNTQFKKAIETFIKNGDIDRASYWFENLLQRQSYDKNFKKLNALKGKVQ